jgi:hypothetical protein
MLDPPNLDSEASVNRPDMIKAPAAERQLGGALTGLEALDAAMVHYARNLERRNLQELPQHDTCCWATSPVPRRTFCTWGSRSVNCLQTPSGAWLE